VRHDLHILDGLEPLIKEVEAELVRQSSLEPWADQAAFLVQLPGIGVHNAMLLLAAIGDIRRFDAVLAVLAIRRRDFTSHGAWMTRAYAIALGAGTQVLTMLPWVVIFGPIGAADELPRTVLMTAGWVINLGVAEYVIRRRRGRRPHRTSAGVGRSAAADARSATAA
jgi:hypothetical protein